MVFVLGVFSLIVLGLFAYRNQPATKVENKKPSAGEITVRGEVVCLPHKNNKGPQTLECAFGLKDMDGNYYGLKDPTPDYRVVSEIPMGRIVEITGTFTPDDSTIYASIGVIEIKSYSVK